MPARINTALKGKEYPPFTVTVERGKIKEFARAIGDLSPFYLDDAVGRASPWGDIIAPPTFPTTFRDEARDTTAFLAELGTDISRLLHGEQEFEHFKPMRPGESYVVHTKVEDIYEKTGRSGPMAFVVRRATVVDADGEVVTIIRHITVVRL
jgi:acyl dehydratase